MNKKVIWIITLFPEYFDAILKHGIVSRAFSKIELKILRLSDYCKKDFKGVDDTPYGGGAGVVIRADVLKNSLFQGVIRDGNYGDNWREKLTIICPDPKGVILNQNVCQKFCSDYLIDNSRDLVFICGRYQGIDQRFLDNYVDIFISVGDFILTGGEIATLTILDSTLRLIPGVIGNDNSTLYESFNKNLLEHAHYTRPNSFEGLNIPDELLSGDHKRIDKFRKKNREKFTKRLRPDLYKKYQHENV